MKVESCFLATLTFVCLIWPSNDASAESLRIGAWNMMFYSADPFDNASHIEAKPVRRSATDIRLSQDIIRQIDVDILALQEVKDASALDHFSLDYQIYLATQVEKLDDRNMVHNAIMVRRSLGKRIRRMFTVEESIVVYWENSGDKLERRVTRPFVGVELEEGDESRLFLAYTSSLEGAWAEISRIRKRVAQSIGCRRKPLMNFFGRIFMQDHERKKSGSWAILIASSKCRR